MTKGINMCEINLCIALASKTFFSTNSNYGKSVIAIPVKKFQPYSLEEERDAELVEHSFLNHEHALRQRRDIITASE
jgi:hypothetical protein